MKIYIPKRNNNKADGLEKEIRSSLINLGHKTVEDPKDCDYILSIGGDGTLLHNIYVLRDHNKPIVSANGGSVGHHAFIKKNEIKKGLNDIQEAKQSSYNFLKVSTDNKFEDYAAQDIRVERSDHHAIVMKVKEDKKILSNRHLADGVIVSNSFGITGYNISAGGLNTEIKKNDMVVTPICPFPSYPEIYDSLRKSKIVKNTNIEIIPEKEARLVLDNRAHIIPANKLVKISISNKFFRIITPNP